MQSLATCQPHAAQPPLRTAAAVTSNDVCEYRLAETRRQCHVFISACCLVNRVPAKLYDCVVVVESRLEDGQTVIRPVVDESQVHGS